MMEDAIRKVLEDLFNLQPLMLNRSMGIAQNENFSPVQLYVLFTLQCREEMTLADLLPADIDFQAAAVQADRRFSHTRDRRPQAQPQQPPQHSDFDQSPGRRNPAPV